MKTVVGKQGMTMDDAKKSKKNLEELIEELKRISYIKPQEIPNIELYMDQVTTFMDRHLEDTKRYSEDKLLTKTMINNYTKNNLLPSPQKKKYSKDHMFLLIFIYYLKNILSITDIHSLLNPLTEMFFGGKGEISLEEIYEEIYQIERAQSYPVAKDIAKKVAAAEETFSHVEGEAEREYLKNFAYACMLCYDIYVKRQMLEKLIDNNFAPQNEKDAKDAKEK
ncbi:MAG: DUF1836 domain-containing protein [Lachnospiraceae bacterium]